MRRPVSIHLYSAALGLALIQSGSAARATIPFQRGVNFTAEGRDGYTAEVARQTLVRLRRYGVDSVALVPYAFTPGDRPVLRYNVGMERDDAVASVAAVARELGFKILLKPQVWLQRGFPGDLDFASEADRSEWFTQYAAFVDHQARLATRIRADIFCVGVEFVKLSGYEDQWRKLFARARRLYSGPLTYAATQGQEFERIRFWDALDYIGLNEYYPLSDDYSATAIADKVEQVSKRFRRPVLLTEVGFSSYERPHREPWDESRRKLSMSDQARAYDAVLRAFYGRSWLHGIYWWKVGTNGYGGPDDGSHTPWGKPAMEVVKRYYQSGRR